MLGDLPSELVNALFSKARDVALKADQNLFMEGDEASPLGGIIRRKLIYNQIFKLAIALCLVDRTVVSCRSER